MAPVIAEEAIHKFASLPSWANFKNLIGAFFALYVTMMLIPAMVTGFITLPRSINLETIKKFGEMSVAKYNQLMLVATNQLHDQRRANPRLYNKYARMVNQLPVVGPRVAAVIERETRKRQDDRNSAARLRLSY
jgi:hypothetical protein